MVGLVFQSLLSNANNMAAGRAARDYLEQVRQVDISRVGDRRLDPVRVGGLLRALGRHCATEAKLSTLAADTAYACRWAISTSPNTGTPSPAPSVRRCLFRAIRWPSGLRPTGGGCSTNQGRPSGCGPPQIGAWPMSGLRPMQVPTTSTSSPPRCSRPSAAREL